jgi:uncharacterized protein (TIRG00374 family)
LKKKILNIVQYLIFFGIGGGILIYFYHQQEVAYIDQCRIDGIPAAQCSLWDKLVKDFLSVDVFWMSMVLLAFTVSNISRAIRWNMLIRELGYKPRARNAFFAVMISYLANLLMSRAGEVVRAGYMAKYEKISTSKVMGTVIVDRILDVISLGLVVGLAFLLEFDTYWTYLKEQISKKDLTDGFWTNPIFLVLVAMVLTGGLLLYLNRHHFRHLNIYQQVKTSVHSMWEGFKTVKYVDKPIAFIFHSLNIWVMYFLMTWCCFSAFAPTEHLTLIAALTVFVFGSFGMVIPSPGGMGTYHVLCVAALSIYGISKSDAFSFANIIFFSINLFCNIFMGALSLILMPIVNRGYQPQPVGKAVVETMY